MKNILEKLMYSIGMYPRMSRHTYVDFFPQSRTQSSQIRYSDRNWFGLLQQVLARCFCQSKISYYAPSLITCLGWTAMGPASGLIECFKFIHYGENQGCQRMFQWTEWANQVSLGARCNWNHSARAEEIFLLTQPTGSIGFELPEMSDMELSIEFFI